MSDIAYYQRRLAEEQALAAAATDPSTIEFHQEIASLYQKMLDVLEGRGAGQREVRVAD